MDELSSAIMVKALDALSTRQMYIAQNIANANTPDYKPVDVSFEKSLKAAASKGMNAVKSVSPYVHYSENIEGTSELRLDLELATAAQTSMRYGALIEIMGRQMSLARTVVNGGQ